MAIVLKAERLRYSYVPGQVVLDDVSLAVPAHTVLYLLGHNGCGKTTLLEVLSGVRAPQAGEVWLDGERLRDIPAHRRAQRIGLVPQVHTPVFAYTVREVVMMGRTPHLPLLGTPGRRDREIVEQAIEQVGLSALIDRPYTELSGGERQLALIARGLAQQTDILLLDEPTAHLDPRNQQLVLETVAALAQERIAFVISSHNPNSALLYAHQVALMKEGRVIAVGQPLEVLTEEALSHSYGMTMDVVVDGTRGIRAVMPRRNGIFLR